VLLKPQFGIEEKNFIYPQLAGTSLTKKQEYQLFEEIIG
jgi:hypothetical protein